MDSRLRGNDSLKIPKEQLYQLTLIVDRQISCRYTCPEEFAGVAELVYAYVSEAYGESLESSNLSSGTIYSIKHKGFVWVMTLTLKKIL